MSAGIDLDAMAVELAGLPGLAAKADIAAVATRLGIAAGDAVPVGDDCAAVPAGDGWTLFAIEGFINAFVAADPWFAGWCGIMVNLSDVAAMGGRPIAVVDAIFADGEAAAVEILAGMRAASEAYGVPIVGGHTNLTTDRPQLSVAVLGHARALLTSFDARPGDRLVAAIDLRGRYREPFDNFEAATTAPPGRLRADLALLAEIAEAGLSRAGKDISQAGLVGTAAMLAESSGVGVEINLANIPLPDGVALSRWLKTFPSYGYLLAVEEADVGIVLARFAGRDIAAAEIGGFVEGAEVALGDGERRALVRNLAATPLMGFSPRVEVPA